MFEIYIVPFIIMIVGYIMYKYPPKKINWIIGYRTLSSMKNEKVWKLANKYCGLLWINTGIILFAISLVISIIQVAKMIVLTENIIAIIILVQVLIIILPVFIVERKLKQEKI